METSVNRGIMFSFFNDAHKRACEEYRLRLCNQLGISLDNTYWYADKFLQTKLEFPEEE